MAVRDRFRFSMAAIMMLVVTAAAASAVFAKVRSLLLANTAISTSPWVTDAPALLLLGIVLTALAIAAVRKHTAVQAMLQVTVACLALLPVLYLEEASST